MQCVCGGLEDGRVVLLAQRGARGRRLTFPVPLLLKTNPNPSAVVLATKLPLCSGDVKLEVGVPGVQLLSTSLSASGIAVNPRRFSMDSLWRMVAAAAGGESRAA